MFLDINNVINDYFLATITYISILWLENEVFCVEIYVWQPFSDEFVKSFKIFTLIDRVWFWLD